MNSPDSLLLTILHNLDTGIYLINSDMDLIWLNEELKKWFVPLKKPLQNTKCHEFIFNKNLPCNNCPVLRLDNTSKIEVSTVQLSTLQGKKRQYRFRAKRIDSEHSLIMVMDITDQLQSERMREDFVATLTHDLRTPLLAELRTLELFARGVFGPVSDKQMEVLDTMLISNRDLLAMVKNLLEVYKYEAGAKVLSTQSFDIAKLIEECIFELSPLAETKNIDLSHEIPEVLPLIMADRREIWRVITNLLGNAIEYTAEFGRVTLSVTPAEDHILVEVADNGRGIPENEIDSLFERFSQGTSENISSGTGLGLYLSRQIIQAHNGRIWAESKPGAGSKFYFTLPLIL